MYTIPTWSGKVVVPPFPSYDKTISRDVIAFKTRSLEMVIVCPTEYFGLPSFVSSGSQPYTVPPLLVIVGRVNVHVLGITAPLYT